MRGQRRLNSRVTILPLERILLPGAVAVSSEYAIARAVASMGLHVPEGAAGHLDAYVNLLAKWNRVYNLTAVRNRDAVVTRHILDSLAILPWLQGPRVLDVGSGAGLPGIPLAVARPHLHFSLLDCNQKRTRFLIQAIADLGLNNVEVIRCRVEDYQPGARFESVVSRAFAALSEMLLVAGRLCATGGRILAMKGLCSETELAEIPADYALVGVYPLKIPGLNATRQLVHMTPVGARGTRPDARVGI